MNDKNDSMLARPVSREAIARLLLSITAPAYVAEFDQNASVRQAYLERADRVLAAYDVMEKHA